MAAPILIHFDMKPFAGEIDMAKAALVIIDMQRDFLESGGFGESLGNDVSKLQRAIDPCQAVLTAARNFNNGMLIVHTREGHCANLSDLHQHKGQRLGQDSNDKQVIGSVGPMGRVLIRGEVGHDIIPQLYPQPGEPVIDKPGKGSFYMTDLDLILKLRGIETLFVCGVTTEVCVHSTIREANDRGYHCIAISDACASFFDEFHKVALEMIVAQKGIFGSTLDSATFVKALETHASRVS